MKTNRLEIKDIISIASGIVFGVIFMVFTDFFCTFSCGILFRTLLLPVIFVAASLVMILIFRLFPHLGIAMIALIPVVCTVLAIIYMNFRKNSAYINIGTPQKEFFSDKTVMFIVPHEDDDINLTSGMIDNFIRCNSRVYPVFVTNGDYYDLGKERINEAIRGWKTLGVPEDNIYFLGYGDQWSEKGSHIYNAPDDMQMTSAVGRTETYGTETHPAYNDGNVYTHENYMNDLKSVMLEKKPDILFSSDTDPHVDHIAVSFAFEQVMGEILKNNPEYRPIIYKGYAYSTAWRAVDDFYAFNVHSTIQPDVTDDGFPMKDWGDRVRFPVGTDSLARSVFETDIYAALRCHKTQNASAHAINIINGDKVYWQRRSDSLLKDADIRVSSGDGKYLNDFMTLDSSDVNSYSRAREDGVWDPDEDDEQRTVHVTMKEASDIRRIVLYDNPSLEDNTIDAEIIFSDGTTVETGQLLTDGYATCIDVNKKRITGFDIVLTDTAGEHAGIAEIEAFENRYQKTDSFIKLVDENNDFIYDYVTQGDEAVFSIYSNDTDMPAINEDDYEVELSADDNGCTYNIDNGKLLLSIPRGGVCELTVREKNSGLRDNVVVRNSDFFERTGISVGQYIEKKYVYPISEGKYSDLAMCRLYEKLRNII